MLWRYGMSAMINFQFHLIGRIDDSTQVLIENLRMHDSFANCLKTKLNWSKNVGEERDAPWQVVLGSMDTVYCVLVSMAIWMETNMRDCASAMNSPYIFSFSDDVAVPSGGKKAKNIAQAIFGQQIFKMEQFNGGGGADDSGLLLGSHSIRKYAATHARKCGCNKDEKDIRGRWKGKGRVSDVYDDVELPFPDAKVAEKLSIGGACYYLFPNEDLIVNGGVVDEVVGNHIEMMRTFVLSEVVPNIRRRVPDSCAVVLGKAFLWFIYSSAGTPDFISQDFKKHIKKELNEILTALGVDVSVENFNPIRRVPVIVSGDQGSVFIDVIQVGEEAGGGGEGVAGGAGGGGRPTGGMNGMNAQMMAMHSLSTQIRREVHEIKLSQAADRTWMQRNFGIVNTNMRRIGASAAMRVGRTPAGVAVAVGGAGGDDENMLAVVAGLQNLARTAASSLSPCPRTLYDLWTEFMLGLGGRKPASQFTQVERGRVKHKYFRRNVIWKMVQRLVRMGLTSDSAIDRIYTVYGAQMSVTRIINGVIEDKKRGRLNPNLG